MSNERTANGGRLTRAMHRAAAALYGASFEREREEPIVEDSEVSENKLEEGVHVASIEVVSDLSADRHDEGSGVAETSVMQGVGDKGIPDSSGETQR